MMKVRMRGVVIEGDKTWKPLCVDPTTRQRLGM